MEEEYTGQHTDSSDRCSLPVLHYRSSHPMFLSKWPSKRTSFSTMLHPSFLEVLLINWLVSNYLPCQAVMSAREIPWIFCFVLTLLSSNYIAISTLQFSIQYLGIVTVGNSWYVGFTANFKKKKVHLRVLGMVNSSR